MIRAAVPELLHVGAIQWKVWVLLPHQVQALLCADVLSIVDRRASYAAYTVP